MFPKSPWSVLILMFWEATLIRVMTGFTWDQNETGEVEGGSGIIIVGRCIFLCNLERRFMRPIKMIICSERSQDGLGTTELSLQEMKGVGGLFIRQIVVQDPSLLFLFCFFTSLLKLLR